MDHLLAGYRRFREQHWPAERSRYQALAREGQSPETMMVACSDSRVDPQTVFCAGPGELFVVRNVAGLVPPYQPDGHSHGTSAALEFGVRSLKVRRIVVLGHAQCGGVQALVKGAPVGFDFIQPWMAIAEPILDDTARTMSEEEFLVHCEREIVRLSLANLLTFPWIAEAVESGHLVLEGFRFGIRNGVLERLEGTHFIPVV